MIAGQVGTTVQMSTVANVSAPLAAGSYSVWAPTQNAYITLAQPNVAVSSLLSVTTGYPVIGGAAPVKLTVPTNGQIGCISSSSGVLAYQKD
jgi:hypothetical protein